MTEPVKLVMAEIDGYGRVEFSDVDALPYEGFAQYVVTVRRGSQDSCYYLNSEGGAWVPKIDCLNATIAFGDGEAQAAEALRAQRLVVAERKEQELARFRETTAGMVLVTGWRRPAARGGV